MNAMKKRAIVVAVATSLGLGMGFSPAHAQPKEPPLPQPDPAGSVLDGRLSEMNENGAYFAQKPYSEHPVSRAVARFINGGSMCTASVIDSESGLLAITAAHCIAKADGPVWKITDATRNNIAAGKSMITPAFDGTSNDPAVRNPYKSWKVADAFVPENSSADVAILKLAPNAEGKTIQEVTGAFGIHPELAEGEQVQASLIGYPGPAPFNGQSQSVCVGNYTRYPGQNNREIHRVPDEKECWVGGGASGGPYVTASDDPNLAGEIITVLNSNGGANIAAVIDELVTKAEGGAENTPEQTVPTSAESTTTEATPTTEATTSEEPSPEATTTPATTEATTTEEATTEPTTTEEASAETTPMPEPAPESTEPVVPIETTFPADDPVSPSPSMSTVLSPSTSEPVAITSASQPQSTAMTTPAMVSTETHTVVVKKKDEATNRSMKIVDSVKKNAHKTAKKNRPKITTGGVLLAK
ncbi:serine protease [Corynebacterium sp. sy039]|uniref:trypsin-like serine peptidase n=1 Tax=Corynebacterium sp. sy039 TaxID=2599641 RepID=UPI00143D8B91|nr:trypsin-like peptidase domain-containing protein [Corynebacterium sp. sy039]